MGLWQGNRDADRLATQGIGLHRDELVDIGEFRERRKLLGDVQGYLLRRFQILACRRGTRWGEDERVDCRMKGQDFLASFRKRKYKSRQEKFEGYIAQHALEIKGNWERCRRCLRRTKYPGSRSNRAAAWRRECVENNKVNGHDTGWLKKWVALLVLPVGVGGEC